MAGKVWMLTRVLLLYARGFCSTATLSPSWVGPGEGSPGTGDEWEGPGEAWSEFVDVDWKWDGVVGMLEEVESVVSLETVLMRYWAEFRDICRGWQR